MRTLSLLLISSSLLLATGCGDPEINGRSFKGALRSVQRMKNRLPQQQRIPFELSFWAVRNTYLNNREFLDIVGGKTAVEVIASGKEVFSKRKAEGFSEYQQYNNWDEMIKKYTDERREQSLKKSKRDPRDESNSVIYEL